MKYIVYLTSISLLIVSIYVLGAWVVIEFILHVLENSSFNWWSIYSFIINVIVLISVIFIPIIVENKIRKRKRKLLRNQRS